jgi:hypothetical protein
MLYRTLNEISLDDTTLAKGTQLRPEVRMSIYAASNTPDVFYVRLDGSLSIAPAMPFYHSLISATETRDVYYVDRQGILHPYRN